MTRLRTAAAEHAPYSGCYVDHHERDDRVDYIKGISGHRGVHRGVAGDICLIADDVGIVDGGNNFGLENIEKM